jgi:hypothetical protein
MSRTVASTLRAQGAYLDEAARSRSVPGERHLGPVPEWTSADKPLGLVWVLTPSYPLIAAGLEKTLEGMADVRIGGTPSPQEAPLASCSTPTAWRTDSSTAWGAFMSSILACRCWCAARAWILRSPAPH